MRKGEKFVERTIKKLKNKGKVVLIPYITCWDPDLETTEAILWEIAEIEPGCVELGFPFSDPVADGPTIQKAVVRALKNKPTLEEFFSFVQRLNQNGFPVPLVCMTYYNIFYRYGLEKVVADAKEVGLSGFIVPDLPVEEAKSWKKLNREKKLATIFLAAPTSSKERIKKIARASTGFLYYVSLTGITGARDKLPEDVVERLELVRTLSKVPVAVGFGISKPEHVRMLSPHADALVVGSAIVKIVEEKGKKAPKEVKKFLQGLKNA
ncbi:MAG: tryptophan synthase subunit alpha [Thermodesulfobacteria bacterium]|nr:tryptophan synthase subunit alpha [Thermodesulfobacteriota bacterium]